MTTTPILAALALTSFAVAAPAQTPLGAPWVEVAPQAGTLERVERSPANPSLVLATHGARVVRSTDGGVSLVEVPVGLSDTVVGVGFADDGTAFLAAGRSLLFSTDGAQTFSARALPVVAPSVVSALGVDPGDSQRAWVATTAPPRLWRTIDRGTTWTAVTPPTSFFAPCEAIAVDRSQSNRAVAISRNYFAHVTTDGGVTWLESGYVNAGDTGIDVAFVGANIVVATSARVVLSTDGGATFVLVPAPTGSSLSYFFASCTDLEQDPFVPTRVFVGAASGGVFASQDAGLTWAPWPGVAGHAVGSVAAGAQGHLLLTSANVGLVAAPLTGVPVAVGGADLALLGLVREVRPMALSSDPGAPQRLALVGGVVGSAVTLFRSGDGGATWSPDLSLDASPRMIEFAPNGVLYVGARGSATAVGSRGSLLREDPSGWTPIGPLVVASDAQVTVTDLAVSALAPAALFAATLREDFASTGPAQELVVHRSLDGGVSWTPVYTRQADVFAPRADLQVTAGPAGRAVHFLDTALDYAFSGFDGSAVQSSVDDGGTWRARPLGMHQETVSNDLTTSRSEPGRVYLASVLAQSAWPLQPLLHSDDGGGTWVGVGRWLQGPPASLAGSSALAGVVYAVRGPGVQRIEYAGALESALEAVPGDLGSYGTLHVTGAPERVYALGSGGLFMKALPSFIGASVCGPAALNSSGARSGLLVLGSTSVAANGVELLAWRVPLQTAGLFIVSDQGAFVPGAGGSAGALCLGGGIGRFGPGAVLSGTSGQLRLAIDLGAFPRPTGPVVVIPGQTWTFQAWFRDMAPGGAATSNFSDAVRVTFTP